MASEGRIGAIAQVFDQVFVDRELILRANDRVGYLRIRKWMQVAASVAVIPIVGWIAFSSISYFYQGDEVAKRDQEIAQRQVAYFDLLAEVSEYHTQYARITGDLEANQDYLLSLLSEDAPGTQSLEVIQERLRDSVTERDRVVLARDSLQKRLRAFEADLQKIANRNVSLQAEVTEMTSALENTEAERAAVAEARERLGVELQHVESELTETKQEKTALESSMAVLRRELAEAEGQRKELETAERDLRERIGAQEQALSSTRETRDRAESELTGLRADLARSNQRQEALVATEMELKRKMAQQSQELDSAQEARDRLEGDLVALRAALHQATERQGSMASAEQGLQQQVAELEAQARAGQQLRGELETALQALRRQAAADGVKHDEEKAALEAERDRLEQRLAALEAGEDALQKEIAALTASVSAADKAAQDASSERDLAIANLQDLDQQLVGLTESKAETDKTIGDLRKALETANTEGQALTARQQSMEARATELTAQLETAEDQRETLEQQLAALQESKSTAESQTADLLDQKGELEARVAELSERLEETRGQSEASEADVVRLTAELEQALSNGDDLKTDKIRLVERVASLERELALMRDAQENIVKRLSKRTLSSVDKMEETISMTGVDLQELLSQVDIEPSSLGRGGPFIPGDFIGDGTRSVELQSSVALLDLHIGRWEALQEIVRTLPLVAPLEQYRLSSGFGYRKDPLNGRKGLHEGLDFSAPARTPIYATSAGKVVFAGWRGRYGRIVEIDHGLGIKTRYAHMKKILVKPGQEIGHREKIGLVGSSGRSTGPHLHYEVLINGEPVDPKNFLKAGNHVFKS